MDYVDDLRDLVGREVVDPHGDKIGRISGVYVDDATGEPSWLAVTTGWFGTNVSFVPFAGSYVGGDELVVAYEKDVVRGAPNCGADRHLNGDEEYSLYDYYDLAAGGYSRPDLAGDVVATPPRDAHARIGEDDAMTRSEEELEVSKHRTEVGRARLRKWVETEYVNITVPIRREKARLVIEPVGERNLSDMLDAPELREVTLSEEEIDISKRVVPKERVRLEKVVELEEVPVDEAIRKERIEFDQDQTP